MNIKVGTRREMRTSVRGGISSPLHLKFGFISVMGTVFFVEVAVQQLGAFPVAVFTADFGTPAFGFSTAAGGDFLWGAADGDAEVDGYRTFVPSFWLLQIEEPTVTSYHKQANLGEQN